jgi:hypothetical protein
MPAPQLLDRRALNRATLARQLLLERAAIPAEDAVRHLVGLQAQTAQSWYLTLWSRLSAFDAVAVSELLDDRRLVRLALMRSTIHLVTDDDAPLLRRFSQPAIDRSLRGKFGRRLDGIDLDELAALVRQATAGGARTPAELWQAADERWPGHDRMTLTNALRAVVPLVQVPPRGIWRQSGAVRLAPLARWLGSEPPESVDVAAIARRYLAAFGPASVADMQAWSGVTRLGETFERLRPELIPFRDEAGRELFDLPDAPRPDPSTCAPVRFLADFDNLLLSHVDRTRFGPDPDRKAIAYQQVGPLPGALLVDGFVAGRWHIERDATSATLVVLLLRPRRRMMQWPSSRKARPCSRSSSLMPQSAAWSSHC